MFQMKNTHGPKRSEVEIFDELSQLCESDGYEHAFAFLCFRDNVIHFEGELNPKDVAARATVETLIRTELSTLLGLMCRGNAVFGEAPPHNVGELIERTDRLLAEMHTALSSPEVLGYTDWGDMLKGGEQFLSKGSFLREAIFYASESAYPFQYAELSLEKYSDDAEWILANKGFSPRDARAIVETIGIIQDEMRPKILSALKLMPMNTWTLLPLFRIEFEYLVQKSGIASKVVSNFLTEFSTIPMVGTNVEFTSLDVFNEINIRPILKKNDGYYLFQLNSLWEAVYEVPAFWMQQDRKYSGTAANNRGEFLEHNLTKKLGSVFGPSRVHKGVHIWGAGRNEICEIDALVIYADRAIVVQAKTKRLTIDARRGNDNALQSDFKKSVQEAYDQALICAKCLQDDAYFLTDENKQPLKIEGPFKEIFLFCIVSDHYPALAYQSRQFLKTEVSPTIKSPFVFDVFLLDVMCEFLNSPLQFLSYINRRVGYDARILASNELVVLGYHLSKNLWLDSGLSMLHLDDTCATELDIAMLARRANIPGNKTPPGLLTLYGNSLLGDILRQIENAESPVAVDMGFLFLQLSEVALDDLSKALQHLIELGMADKENHDLTLGVGDTGLCIHVNVDQDDQAANRLSRHCQKRKYTQKASSWFGLCINPMNGQIRFALKFEEPWEASSVMENATRDMATGFKDLRSASLAMAKSEKK